MSETNRSKSLQEEEEGREPAPAAPPVYDDGAARKQSALYEQIAARGPFRYDEAQDPLYRLARDRYVQDGRLAMRDTMGRAAALTGGYDSSYGQAVGQQQYEESLRGLAQMVPELYEQAYAMYRDQGEDLQRQAEQLGKQADRDYDRYRDQLGDWERERAGQQQREDAAYDRSGDAYARLYALISATGYSPTEQELTDAGMSAGAAEALREEYLRKTGQLPASDGSGGGGSGSGGSSSKREAGLSIDDVLLQARAARNSNQHKELYRASVQAIAQGRADFSRAELDALWRRHHWQD